MGLKIGESPFEERKSNYPSLLSPSQSVFMIYRTVRMVTSVIYAIRGDLRTTDAPFAIMVCRKFELHVVWMIWTTPERVFELPDADCRKSNLCLKTAFLSQNIPFFFRWLGQSRVIIPWSKLLPGREFRREAPSLQTVVRHTELAAVAK